MLAIHLLKLCLCLLWHTFTFSRALDCRLEYFQSLTKDLKRFDSGDLSKYQNVASKLEECLDGTVTDLSLFRNEIYYKMGLIHLSLGNDMKAMKAFEELQKLGDSYYNLGKNRLSDLYIEFGQWERLKTVDPEDETWQIFQNLNTTLYEKINDPNGFATIDDELVPMLNIAPYDLDTLTIRADFLFNRLIIGRKYEDLTSAYEITRIYDIILEKFKSTLSLRQRIELHYTSALIHLLILNTEPTLHLRKCLAIDMDYKPCKQLSLIVSRLNKVNPTRSQLFDPQSYIINSNINWDQILNYYLNEQTDKMINYEWIENKIKDLINDNMNILVTNRTVTKHLFPIATQEAMLTTADNFSFFKFIKLVLCQTNMELSLSKGKQKDTYKQNMNRFCKKTLKQTMPPEEWNNFADVIKKQDAILSQNLLNNLWNTYPTLAIYLIDNVIFRKNFKHNVRLQDEIIKFFNDENLFSAEDPFIKRQATFIQKILNKKQEKVNERRQRQQREQQQQQWNFFEQFAHGQQRQQQQQPQQPMHNTDKDYYKILGVSKSSNSKDIRKAYLNLTKKYHPDKQGSLSEDEQKKVHEKMSEINEAYEYLSDDGKRNEYDQARAGGGARRPGSGQGNGGFNFHQQGNPFPFGNMRYGF